MEAPRQSWAIAADVYKGEINGTEIKEDKEEKQRDCEIKETKKILS